MVIYDLKDGRRLHIRKAEENDSLELVNISHKMGDETDNLSFGVDDYYFTQEQEKNFISNIRHKDNCLYIVGIVDDKIIGNLHCLTSPRKRLAHRADIGIGILKEYWNIGIGTALMDYCMKWINGNGIIKKVDLEVREDNLKAINLYIKYGFKVEGRISRGMCVNNKFYDIYKMGMEL